MKPQGLIWLFASRLVAAEIPRPSVPENLKAPDTEAVQLNALTLTLDYVSSWWVESLPGS